MPGVSSGMTVTQNQLSTTPEVVLAANTERKFAEIKNTDASLAIYVGMNSDLNSSNGHKIAAGESFGFEEYVGPIWAVAASGTPTVTAIEW